MSQQSCSKPQVDRVRLASYLTVGVAGAMMSTAHSEAAVVNIDITNLPGSGANISGANAGMGNNSKTTIDNWLGANTGKLELYNSFVSVSDTYWGLDGDTSTGSGVSLLFAVNGPSKASPRNFGSGTIIDSSATFTGSADRTGFKFNSFTSPDFVANNFIGFRFGVIGGSTFNYGYLEVTWNSQTSNWQILSGAYESTVNTGILAGATPSAVPGAGLSAMALMALGGGAFRRRSRDRVA